MKMMKVVAAAMMTVALAGISGSSEISGGRMNITIDGVNVPVEWEDNESVKALKDYVPVMAELHSYGGFEQVGSLGMTLPRNDERITTTSCDIVLYSGNQIVIFYGSNTWEYTRLGRLKVKSQEELTGLLRKSGVTITIK